MLVQVDNNHIQPSNSSAQMLHAHTLLHKIHGLNGHKQEHLELPLLQVSDQKTSLHPQ